MINTKEFRIGNLVLFSDSNDLCQLLSIDEYGLGVSIKEDVTWIDSDQLENIPLTEEWLLKFGFKKTNYTNRSIWAKKENNLILNIDECTKNNEFIDFRFYNGTNISKSLIIKSVHQLQNLYFALTFEELEFKL